MNILLWNWKRDIHLSELKFLSSKFFARPISKVCTEKSLLTYEQLEQCICFFFQNMLSLCFLNFYSIPMKWWKVHEKHLNHWGVIHSSFSAGVLKHPVLYDLCTVFFRWYSLFTAELSIFGKKIFIINHKLLIYYSYFVLLIWCLKVFFLYWSSMLVEEYYSDSHTTTWCKPERDKQKEKQNDGPYLS